MINYISSQSYHTLTHWQSGQKSGSTQGDPLKLKNIKTLGDLMGGSKDYAGALLFTGWIISDYTSNITAALQNAKELHQLAYSYHEDGATVAGTWSTDNADTYPNTRGKIYARPELYALAPVYAKKYKANASDLDYSVYFKIYRNNGLIDWIPEAVPYPGIDQFRDVSNDKQISITGYYVNKYTSGGTERAELSTSTDNSRNIKTNTYTSDYTGTVIIPVTRKYMIYAQITTGAPDPMFDDCEADDTITINADSPSAVISAAFPSGDDMPEFYQVPGNLFKNYVQRGSQSPYFTTFTGGGDYWGGYGIFDYVKDPTVYQSGNIKIPISASGNLYGGYSVDLFTAGSTSKLWTPYNVNGYINLNPYSSDYMCHPDKIQGQTNDKGIWSGIYHVFVDLKEQTGFKFFK